jgi:hypothetical protein
MLPAKQIFIVKFLDLIFYYRFLLKFSVRDFIFYLFRPYFGTNYKYVIPENASIMGSGVFFKRRLKNEVLYRL